MKQATINKLLTYLIAIVWVINGLACKVLNLVPRHELIISKILDIGSLRTLTILIGISEILMAIWILSRIKSKLNVYAQIAIVIIMNVLEFSLTPELLLWGRMNLLFATLFIFLVYYNEFKLNKELNQKILK